MRIKEAATIAGIFLLSALIGFNLGSSSEQRDFYSNQLNVTANEDNEIVTARFDNRSINLMYQDSPRFFLDLNRDGSYDREINITGEGVRETTELVTLEGRSYNLYLQYNSSKPGWIKLYRAERVQ